MTTLRTTVEIEAAPEAVWEVLGDLAATSEWIPGILAARVVDGIRVCQMVDGAEIHEKISEYSPELWTYRYRHLRLPLPIRDSTGTFTVERGTNGGSVVVLDSAFEPLDPTAAPEIEQMYGAALEQALESLRRRVEEGRMWNAAS